MNNFWRAIQLTFKHKWNIIGIFVSSIALALCWGGNITAVYPLVQVSFQGDSVSTWLEKEIQSQTERLEELRAEQTALVDAAKTPVDGDDSSAKNAANRLSFLNAQIATAEKTLAARQAALPWARKWTPSDPFLTVVALMAFVLIGTIVKSFCTFIHSFLSSRIGQLGAYELRALFFKKALGYEVNYFNARGLSDATSRFMSDMGALSSGVALLYGKALREPLKMIVCLVGAALVSWRLLIFTLLFVPIAAVSIRWLAKSLKRVVRRSMQETARLYGCVEETFRAIRVVKSFNGEGCETTKFCRVNKTNFERGMKTAKYDALTSPITETLGIFALVLAILMGAYLVIHQQTTLFGIPFSSRPLDLGSLILFYGFLIGASDPARRLTDIFTHIQTACAAADRVYEIVDRDVPIQDAKTPKRLEKFADSLVFDGVCYEYPLEAAYSEPPRPKKVRLEDVLKKTAKNWAAKIFRPRVDEPRPVDATPETNAAPPIAENETTKHNRAVLKNASFEIKFGETVAIVGRSGCGKSTLLSLIPRFVDPTEGRVLLDGVPLTELKMSDVRDQIGLVAQDSVLFNATVLENIRYGRPDATREEAIEAAKQAFADEFIRNELADGYETVVGPGGGLLSGGQRQRLALARAFLKNPRILLLDEATSQIDLQSERYIHQALKNYIGGRTTILITHRLSAIQLADRVVVMEDGVVQFVGTHREALENSPFYANLWATNDLDVEDAA